MNHTTSNDRDFLMDQKYTVTTISRLYMIYIAFFIFYHTICEKEQPKRAFFFFLDHAWMNSFSECAMENNASNTK